MKNGEWSSALYKAVGINSGCAGGAFVLCEKGSGVEDSIKDSVKESKEYNVKGFLVSKAAVEKIL